MSALIDRAEQMLRSNRTQRGERRFAAALGTLLAVVICGLLMGRAAAMAGGNILKDSLTGDSAIFWKAPDAGEDAWQKTDGSSPVPKDDKLRLRLAFKISPEHLKDGTTFAYTLPQGLSLPDTASGISLVVFDGKTASSASEKDAKSAGTARIDGNVLTVTLEGADVTKEASCFVDLDFTFDRLSLDDEGAVKLALNGSISRSVVRASVQKEEPAATTDASKEEQASSEASADTAAPAAEPETAAADAASNETIAAAEDAGGAAAAESETASTETAAQDEANASATAMNEGVSEAKTALSASGVRRNVSLLSAASPVLRRVAGTNYLDSATVSKNVNGTWTPVTSVTEGDDVRVDLSFSFPSNTITSSNKDVTYTLPSGIGSSEALTNVPLMENNTQVGTFDVATDGTVTMHFYDKYATGNAIDADLFFEGKVQSTGSGQGGTISFKDKNSTQIAVKPKEKPDNHDVSIQKSGNVKKDNKGNIAGADYTITVSTTQGTDGAVDVMDTLSWANNVDYANGQSAVASMYYDRNSLQVVKKRSSGDNGQLVSLSSYKAEWTSADNKPRFVVRGLPALAPGESYEVRYSAAFKAQDANKDASIDNAATAYTPKHRADTSKQIDWKTDDTKSGQYDSGHQTIHWTVTLNQNGKNTDGLSMTDNLPGDLVGDITVKDANGNAVMALNADNSYYVSNSTGYGSYSKDNSRQLTVNFSSGSGNGQYTIEYQTKVPAGTTAETVSNTVKTKYGDGTKHEATGTVGVTHQTSWDISKSTQANTANGTRTGYQSRNKYLQAWSMSVTMPESPVSSFTVHDEIGSMKAQDGTEYGSSYHYAIAKDLYEELCQYGITLTQRNDSATRLFSNRSDGNRIAFMDEAYENTDALTAEVTMRDASGAPIDNPSESDAHVKSFDVKIVPKDGGTIEGSNLTIIYSTTIDLTASDVPEDTIVKAENTASTQGKTFTASTDVRKNAEFLKQTLKGTTSDNRKIWSNTTKSVEYDKADPSKNTATFRILIDTTGVTGDIEVTDKLPEGMSLSGSARLKYITTNQYSDDEDWSGLLSVSQTGQTITFKVKSGYRTPAQMAIQYDASFASDSDWDDESTNEKSYTNTATWNNKTSRSTVDVKRTPERVMKKGAQVLDENNQPTGTVKYQVVLNPKAEDLNPTSDYLDLTDVLTADASLQPDLDIQDVKLYAYSATAADHIDWNKELPDAIFSAAYDSASHTLKAKIPDSTACVLVYEYELQGFSSLAADKSISNSVSVNGEWSKTASTSIKSRKAGGSATKGQFFLYKVDANNYKNLLSGATFDLYSGEGGSFTEKLNDYLIDKYHEWDLLDTSPDHAIFKHDVLYKFVETKAPADYTMAADPIYVAWLNKSETEDDAWSAIQSSGILPQATKADGSQIQRADIHFIPYGGGSLYVPNTYSKLTVKKAWTAADGIALEDAPVDSVKVTLYRDVTTEVGWTVTVKATNPWGGTNSASALVKKGSPVTVSTQEAWNTENADMQISLDGGKNWQPMRYDTTDHTWKYVTAPVTSDMTDIQYRSGNNYGDGNLYTPAVSGEKPDKVTESKGMETVSVDADHGWTYSWSELPATDGKGHEYTYHVEEENVSSGFKAIYLGNGITTGTITITNQKMVQLPETGGTGTGLTVAAGAALAAFAAAGLILLRKTGAKRRR